METAQASGESLRRVMRTLPSPVVVVTACGAEEARGVTIGSFTSVSLAPPLVSFNVDRASQMHGVLEEAAHFAVHLPRPEQSGLCARFARPKLSGEEQLRGVAHTRDASGTPILEEVRAVLYCRRYRRFPAGDHTIVVGEVMEVEERAGERPLLYHDRAYRSLL